jgi:FkbM family methyltransferase
MTFNDDPHHQQEYYSQWKQDAIVEKMFKNIQREIPETRIPVCVDIGAHDGKTGSNSLLFENKGWNCICIEPITEVFKDLVANRPHSICFNVAIYNENKLINFTRCRGYTEMLSGITDEYHPSHPKRIVNEISINDGTYENIMVPSCRLEVILDMCSVKVVDFLSIDTEGSEMTILKSIDLDKYHINIIAVEYNYPDTETEMLNFLESKGFIFLIKTGGDLIFYNNLIK